MSHSPSLSDESTSEDEAAFWCNVCNKPFRSLWDLERHQTTAKHVFRAQHGPGHDQASDDSSSSDSDSEAPDDRNELSSDAEEAPQPSTPSAGTHPVLIEGSPAQRQLVDTIIALRWRYFLPFTLIAIFFAIANALCVSFLGQPLLPDRLTKDGALRRFVERHSPNKVDNYIIRPRPAELRRGIRIYTVDLGMLLRMLVANRHVMEAWRFAPEGGGRPSRRLVNVFSGSVYRQHHFHHHAAATDSSLPRLPIFLGLTHDGFTPSNPTRAGAIKIENVYIVVHNIPSPMRYELMILFASADLASPGHGKPAGLDAVSSRLIEFLRMLWAGIEMDVYDAEEGRMRTMLVQGALLTYCADMVAIAELLGLNHFGSANHCCYGCDFHRRDLGVVGRQHIVRHDELIGGGAFDRRVDTLVSMPAGQRDEFVKERGVKRETPWRFLPYSAPRSDSQQCGVCGGGVAHGSCPEGSKDMLSCRKCEHWFHEVCVGITPSAEENAHSRLRFICPDCRQPPAPSPNSPPPDPGASGILDLVMGDPMHNIMEGMLRYHMHRVIREWREAGWLSKPTFMAAVKSLCHTHASGKNRISQAASAIWSSDNQVKATAKKLQYLAPVVRVILFSTMPEGDGEDVVVGRQHLACYKLHCEIIGMVLQREVDIVGDLRRFAVKIDQFVDSFINLYNYAPPKLHAYTHMPLDMYRFGPLREQWCFPRRMLRLREDEGHVLLIDKVHWHEGRKV
ncbi:unnamed protein product, partial [Vitrella brassicaformis CCMP3155]